MAVSVPMVPLFLGVAALWLGCFGTADAKFSPPECKGGCIIASVQFPKQECSCVVPSCDQKELKRHSEATIRKVARQSHSNSDNSNSNSNSNRASTNLQPPQLVTGLDCDFCNRDANTYSRCAMSLNSSWHWHLSLSSSPTNTTSSRSCSACSLGPLCTNSVCMR